jgi:PAS domain-containing protein
LIGLDQVFLYFAGSVLAIWAGIAFIRRSVPSEPEHSDSKMVFLLSETSVVDANFNGRRLLDQMRGGRSRYDQLKLFLSQNFRQSHLLTDFGGASGDAKLQSIDARLHAMKQTSGKLIRLEVTRVDDDMPTSCDIHTITAIENELQTLRTNTSAAPFLLWRQNSEGNIVWVNQAYLDTAREILGDADDGWPLPVIFPALKVLNAPISKETRRIAVGQERSGKEAWYDCHICPTGNDIVFTAVPADEAVRAENRRREFTQTLTKTFAELAIGLAIFDRSRRLVLFNPALMDLTNLPSDFLSSRPSLIGFLDQLRENRVMPEPRDYRSWRASIAELEAAAADGTYSETWALPDGQTFHVTGRPHPDGAVALLFEDISAEMSLSRHFRSEIEQYQAIVDVFDDAVALFSPAGEVTIMNRAYRVLWNIENDEFMIGDLTEATRRWHELSVPTPVWGDFRDFAHDNGDRAEWSETVALRDGRHIQCRFIPRPGGITMAVFKIREAQQGSRLQSTG